MFREEHIKPGVPPMTSAPHHLFRPVTFAVELASARLKRHTVKRWMNGIQSAGIPRRPDTVSREISVEILGHTAALPSRILRQRMTRSFFRILLLPTGVTNV